MTENVKKEIMSNDASCVKESLRTVFLKSCLHRDNTAGNEDLHLDGHNGFVDLVLSSPLIDVVESEHFEHCN